MGKVRHFRGFFGREKGGFRAGFAAANKKEFCLFKAHVSACHTNHRALPCAMELLAFQADSEGAEGIRSLVNLLRMSDNKNSSMDIFLTLPTK